MTVDHGLNRTGTQVESGTTLVVEGAPAAENAPRLAIINGCTVAFGSAEDKFDALVAEWRRLRELGSSTDDLMNDAYGQIVGMGWDAVPLLLREVEKQSGHWFTALRWITGLTLVPPEMRGNIREMRTVWLNWARNANLR